VICSRTDELQESDVGTGCGLFEVRKIGDEYFTYLVECSLPKACTIVLRGASKDILNEVGRERAWLKACLVILVHVGVARWRGTCTTPCRWYVM